MASSHQFQNTSFWSLVSKSASSKARFLATVASILSTWRPSTTTGIVPTLASHLKNNNVRLLEVNKTNGLTGGSRNRRFMIQLQSQWNAIMVTLLTTTSPVHEDIPQLGSSTIVSAIQTESSAHRQRVPRSIIQVWPRNRAGELDLPRSRQSCRILDQLPSSSTKSPSKVSNRSLRVETNAKLLQSYDTADCRMNRIPVRQVNYHWD